MLRHAIANATQAVELLQLGLRVLNHIRDALHLCRDVFDGRLPRDRNLRDLIVMPVELCGKIGILP